MGSKPTGTLPLHVCSFSLCGFPAACSNLFPHQKTRVLNGTLLVLHFIEVQVLHQELLVQRQNLRESMKNNVDSDIKILPRSHEK